MRNTIIACLLFSLAVSLPSSAQDLSSDAAKPDVRDKKTAPRPTAGQPRRRAVRKTPPAGPVAKADSYSVLRGGTLLVDAATGVLANDTEPQAKPLIAILVSGPTQGTLTLNADGGFTYVNNNGSAATSDSFTYKASNGTVDTNAATATITITDPPPQSVNDEYPTGQDTTLTLPPPGVLANDTLNNAAIASYGVNGPEQTTLGINTPTTQGGSVNLGANGGFAYTPANGFTGFDAFHYVLAGSGGSSTAQVSITVTAPPPVAVNDSHTTQQGTQLNVAAPGVLGNDTLNGATIGGYGASSGVEQTTIGASTPTAAGGTIRLNADGSFRYDPSGSFTGNDTFKYVLINSGSAATATVTINVTAANTIDFVVTSPGFFYQFTGVSGSNPVLTLTRGRTYRFQINTSAIHPFEILDAPGGTVTNNNISNGILTFAVPAGAGTYRYHCSIHPFGNNINTTP